MPSLDAFRSLGYSRKLMQQARDRVSTLFRLQHSQPGLDFVDVPADGDIRLFIDPFALSQRPDDWSRSAHTTIVTFFQRVISAIREGRHAEGIDLLRHFQEPNETRLGLSRGASHGAGIGPTQAQALFEALARSSAVKTGFIQALEDCELVVEGVGPDKISDLTTNIIRRHLADYTLTQCELHGIPTMNLPLAPYYSLASDAWVADYFPLPMAAGRPLLLVPKVIVRYSPASDPRDYYEYVVSYLQSEALSASTSLVHALRNGSRVVYKTAVKAAYPLTKAFLLQFSLEHPEVLSAYRDRLSHFEHAGANDLLEPGEEQPVASAYADALRSILPGSDQAPAYHSLMVGLIEFMFFPSLLSPRKEVEIHEGRKRIDILSENGAFRGVFERLHRIRKVPCAFVPIECKNYRAEVANPELDQLSGRFSTRRGTLGLLFCRRFDDRELFIKRCRDTFSDDRGLIVPIDDERVLECLSMLERGERDRLDSLFVRWVDEVYGINS